MVVAEKAYWVEAFGVDLLITFHYLVMQQHSVDPCVSDALVQLVPLQPLIYYYKQQNCYVLKVEYFVTLVEHVDDAAFDGDDALFDESDDDLLMEFELKQLLAHLPY